MPASSFIRRVSTSLVAATAILGMSSAAIAVPPAMGTIGPINIVGQVIADCGGYQVLANYTVEAPFIEHYDKDGQLLFIDYWQRPGEITYYNSTDPTVYLVGQKAIEIARWNFSDGTIALLGQRFTLQVPGYGMILQTAGLARMDMATFEITYEAGNFSQSPDVYGGDTTALCAALAT